MFVEVNEIKRSSSVKDGEMEITEDAVLKVLKAVNVRKSSGPDGVCGRVLKYCAKELCGIFRFIFQASIDLCKVPLIWKTSTVIPVPNDFRSIALTSLAMKCLEKIVKTEIRKETEHLLDPLQFAYRHGKGVEDATLTILNLVHTHLEKEKAHATIMLVDFSSAFNTLQPHLLLKRLQSDFELNPLALWILDFLLARPQRVCVNGYLSDSVCIFTGSPQGCVLYPLLLIVYRNNCTSDHENIFLIKFSDDTAVIRMLFGDQNDHGPVVSDFVNWCDESYLCPNLSKTKDLFIGFRRKSTQPDPTVIHNETIHHYEYLGTTIRF